MLPLDLCPLVLCQSYQSRQSQHVYQYIKEKGIYEIDNNPASEIDEEDLNAKNFYFTNKGYKELQVNFVRIESMYNRCSTSFQSCSTLHKYIKSRCNLLERLAVAETSLEPLSPRPVLHFAAKLSALGSGLKLRDWNYAITSITFDPAIWPAISDPNTSVCLNTSCEVSLVDKAWLAKKHLSQKISTMPMPLKVKGISASRHKSEKFAFTAFYMPSLDRKGSEVYACINYKLYLVGGLKANMLIENNVFCTKDFVINFANASANILSFGVTIIINARNYLQFLRRKVLANSITFIPSKSKVFVNF